jgi:hypothetical protein
VQKQLDGAGNVGRMDFYAVGSGVDGFAAQQSAHHIVPAAGTGRIG